MSPTSARASDRNRIVVGVDGSSHARHAVESVTRFAAVIGVDVLLVHGRGLLEAAEGASPAWFEELLSHAREVLPDTAAGRATRVTVVSADGAPADVLLRFAASEPTVAVVVGRSGAGAAVERALGSTSAEVAARSLVPVVVVPLRRQDGVTPRSAPAPSA